MSPHANPLRLCVHHRLRLLRKKDKKGEIFIHQQEKSAKGRTHPLLRRVVGHGRGPHAALLVVDFGPRHRIEGVVGVREARHLHELQPPHNK